MIACNWMKQHSSPGGVTPTMEAGSCDALHDAEWLAELVEAYCAPPGRCGPYRPKLRLRSG